MPATTRIVTKTADTSDGACNADCSLREAIAAAVSGDTIQFSSLFDSPQTIKSVTDGESQLGLVATSDGSLEQQGLVILEDDKGLQVSQNLVPVVSQQVLEENPEVEDTLNELSDVLTTEDLAAMNAAVDLDRQKPEDVAAEFLQDEGLIS